MFRFCRVVRLAYNLAISLISFTVFQGHVGRKGGARLRRDFSSGGEK